MALIIILALITKLRANVDCITVRSDKSLTKDDAKSMAICPSSHSTLVSCGATTANPDAFSFDGSFMDVNAVPSRCYAQNANGGAGVYSYARCCNFVPQDITCIYLMSSTYSSGADDAVRTTRCGTRTHNAMLGCSVYTPWAKQDGAYPGYVKPDAITQFDTHNYPPRSECSAQNAVNGAGVKASSSCCHSPTYDLQCVTRYGSPSLQISIAACPNGYFMSGCSGWSAYGVNGWYISQDRCFARSQTNRMVYAIAICCRLETDNPTTDPTVPPTPTPTAIPSGSPTYNPTIPPTEMPTKLPSVHPTEVPSMTPSNNPSEFPTNNPSQIPTFDPTHFPTDDPVMNVFDGNTDIVADGPAPAPAPKAVTGRDTNALMGGLVGGLVFLSLCVCCAGTIFGFYLWKKRNIMEDEVSNVQNEGDKEMDMSSIPIEGASTGCTSTGMKQKNTDDGQGYMIAMNSKKNHNLLSDRSDTEEDEPGIGEIFGNGNADNKTPLMSLTESDEEDENVVPRSDVNDYCEDNIINDVIDADDDIFK